MPTRKLFLKSSARFLKGRTTVVPHLSCYYLFPHRTDRLRDCMRPGLVRVGKLRFFSCILDTLRRVPYDSNPRM